MGKANRSKPLKIKGRPPVKQAPVKQVPVRQALASAAKKAAPKPSPVGVKVPNKVAAKLPSAKSAVKPALGKTVARKPSRSKPVATAKPGPSKTIAVAATKTKTPVKVAAAKVTAKPAAVKKSMEPAKPVVAAKLPNAINGATLPAKKVFVRSPRSKVEIILPEGYRPTEDEPFMGDHHRAYFRKKLRQWKEDIIQQNRETLHVLHEDTAQHADIADRATSETDRALDLRARDRQRKLVSKIDAALHRIEEGSYGYCEETGEPISIKRLDARPIATLSLEAQERHERRERVYREE
jgi:DnaK suppressor protein